MGFSSGKKPTCQGRRCRLDPWVRKILWRKKWQPIPVFLTGKISWPKEPGRLQSMGFQRVGHDWATEYTCTWFPKTFVFSVFFFLCVCVPCMSFLSGHAYVFLLLYLLPFLLISFSPFLSLPFPCHSLPSILISVTWIEIDLLNLVMFPVLNFRNRWF